MSRRGRGEGSLTLQKSGLWQARVSAGKNADGTRCVRVAYGRTKKEASTKLHQLRQRHMTGEVEPSRESLGTFLGRWLEHKRSGALAESTLSGYTQVVETYVLRDLIADVPLGKVTPVVVEEFLSRLRKVGKGDCTRKACFVVLKMALKKAAGWGIIHTNPTADGKVDAPKYKAEAREVWTLEQALTFLTAAQDERLYALYVLALTCGLRHGELLGLQWDNVDLEKRSLHVCWSLPEVRGKVLPLKAPKTKAGVRDVPLCELAVVALKKRREAALAEGTAASTYVFPNTDGGPNHKCAVYRSYHGLLETTKLPEIVLHDQRHTAITLLRAQGLDLKLVQVLAGHAHFAVTSDRYAKAYPSEQVFVREAMSEVWGATERT